MSWGSPSHLLPSEPTDPLPEKLVVPLPIKVAIETIHYAIVFTVNPIFSLVKELLKLIDNNSNITEIEKFKDNNFNRLFYTSDRYYDTIEKEDGQTIKIHEILPNLYRAIKTLKTKADWAPVKENIATWKAEGDKYNIEVEARDKARIQKMRDSDKKQRNLNAAAAATAAPVSSAKNAPAPVRAAKNTPAVVAPVRYTADEFKDLQLTANQFKHHFIDRDGRAKNGLRIFSGPYKASEANKEAYTKLSNFIKKYDTTGKDASTLDKDLTGIIKIGRYILKDDETRAGRLWRLFYKGDDSTGKALLSIETSDIETPTPEEYASLLFRVLGIQTSSTTPKLPGQEESSNAPKLPGQEESSNAPKLPGQEESSNAPKLTDQKGGRCRRTRNRRARRTRHRKVRRTRRHR